MIYVISSLVYFLIAIGVIYLAETNLYTVSTVVFEPYNKKWQHNMTFIVVVTLLIIMSALSFLARRPNFFPIWFNVLLWLCNAIASVFLVNTWLRCIKRSLKTGHRYTSKYSHDQIRHYNSRVKHRIHHALHGRHRK